MSACSYDVCLLNLVLVWYVPVPGCLLGTIDCRNSSRVFLEFLAWCCWFFVSVTLTEAAIRFRARPPLIPIGTLAKWLLSRRGSAYCIGFPRWRHRSGTENLHVEIRHLHRYARNAGGIVRDTLGLSSWDQDVQEYVRREGGALDRK